MTDINHPRVLPGLWREEAARLEQHCADHREDAPEAVMVVSARARALEQCAGELEGRLLWSGMLDE